MDKFEDQNVLHLEMIDMNFDDKLDLVVTSQNNDGDLVVYELPAKNLFK